MTHPLTDETIIELIGDRNLFHCLTEDDMRTAADWQLEQVIKQWEEVIDSNKTDIQIIREFDKRLKAMRPQEDTP